MVKIDCACGGEVDLSRDDCELCGISYSDIGIGDISGVDVEQEEFNKYLEACGVEPDTASLIDVNEYDTSNNMIILHSMVSNTFLSESELLYFISKSMGETDIESAIIIINGEAIQHQELMSVVRISERNVSSLNPSFTYNDRFVMISNMFKFVSVIVNNPGQDIFTGYSSMNAAVESIDIHRNDGFICLDDKTIHDATIHLGIRLESITGRIYETSISNDV